MVRGKKPWNKDTILGVVVEHNAAEEDTSQPGDTFKIFWLNEPAATNPFTLKKVFSTWEVMDSLIKVDDGN